MFQFSSSSYGTSVELSGEEARIDLGSHVSILRDPGGTMTIEDVTEPSLAARFEPSRASHVNVPGSPEKIWFRFSLRDFAHEVQGKGSWVLELNCPIVDVVELYVPYPVGNAGYRQVKGKRYGRGSPDTLAFRNYAFHINTQTSRVATCYYLRLGSFGPTTVPLVLRTDEAFGIYTIYDSFCFGLIYGVMLAMILYNLFIFFSLKNSIYLIYVLYMLSFISYFLLFNGHVDAVVNLGVNNSQVLQWFFLGALIFFSVSFCQRFFDTKTYTPGWHWVLEFFKAVAMVIVLLGLLGRHEAAAVLANATGALGPINLVIVGAIRWRQGFGTAKYYILANMSFVFGTLIYILWTLGVLAITVPSNVIFSLGPAIEAEVVEASETRRPLSLIIMDVDNFKHYNDTYGHPEGDVVFRTLAEVVMGEIRDQDLGCRYGGEEFIVVFINVDAAQALKASERMFRSL